MRVFLAGASGVLGSRVVPLLVERGHVVGGMTRSPDKVDSLRELGAEPVVCDVYDSVRLEAAVAAFAPELVMHQLTDLPDDLKRLALHMRRNNRIRTEGTRNLIAAARQAGATRFIAQSIAFKPPGAMRAVAGTSAWCWTSAAWCCATACFMARRRIRVTSGSCQPPRIHVDEAARRTVELLDAPSGVVEIAESR